MARFSDFTNLGHSRFVFNPDEIFAIYEAPGFAGSHTTHVAKIWNVDQMIADTPAEVLSRYGLTNLFVQLTTSRGALWVRAAAVSAMHAPFPGDREPADTQCMLLVGGSTFKCRENVQAVQRLIELW